MIFKRYIRFKEFFILIFFLLSGLNSNWAQDIHFSQFMSAPLMTNPANTGNFNGNYRLVNNFRSQWVSFADPGYNTLSLSFDQLLFSAKKNLSIGGIIIYDQSGTIGMTMSKMYISGSYKKKSGKNKYIFGLQAGGVLRQFNDANALYSNQFDHSTGYHNPVLPSGEIAMAENSNYFNMNIGFVWGRNFSRFKTEAGIAVFNINYPKEGFTGSQDRVRPKLLYSVDLTWFVSHRFYVQPQIIFMQLTGANSLIGGSEFQLLTGNHTSGIESIFMGAYVRSGFNRTTDAVIVSAGINFLKFRLGLSYDLNISELQQYTNSVGAFELSLIYTGISTVFDPGALPCARQ